MWQLILQPDDILRTHYFYNAGEWHMEYQERIYNMYGNEVTQNAQMIQATVSERLENEKAGLEKRLAQVNEALEALNKSPEVKEIINKISAITHF